VESSSVNYQLSARSVAGYDMVFVPFDFLFSVVERKVIAVFVYSITDRLRKVEAVAIVSSHGTDEFALVDDALGKGLQGFFVMECSRPSHHFRLADRRTINALFQEFEPRLPFHYGVHLL
jgi:hypothetical protein